MKHKSGNSSQPEFREKEVIVQDDGVYCPFCTPTHKLRADGGNRCGTTVRISAVQIVIPARVVRQNKLICLKCGKGDGRMVMLKGGQYIHLEDCAPETHIVVDPPAFSRWAQYVMKLPEALRKPIEKYTGKASALKQIDASGHETGDIVGYFFWKDGKNGPTPRIAA